MIDIGDLNVKLNVDTSALQSISPAVVAIGNLISDTIEKAISGITELSKKAVDLYSKNEQLIGGTEKLYEKSAKKVEKYANNAFKTMGMSSNEYMELSTEFAASMISSLEGNTDLAADMVDQAISQMVDNASIMGTDIEMIKTAYKGFAKDTYMALDNLKLGYGGTKKEMERLLADAEAISGIHYEMGNLSDMVEAIGVIQSSMNITGNAAKEATKTLEGSLNSLKASFDNLMIGIANGNEDLDYLLDDVWTSLENYMDNLLPTVEQIVTTILHNAPTVIKKMGESMRSGKIHDELMDLPVEQMVGDFVDLLITTFEQVPGGVETGLKMFTWIIDSLTVSLTDQNSVARVEDAIDDLINVLAQDGPVFIDSITNFVKTLLNKLAENPEKIRKIAEDGVEMVTAIIGALDSQIGVITTAVSELVKSVCKDFADNGQDLSVEIAALVKKIITDLIDNINLISREITELTISIFEIVVEAMKDPESRQLWEDAWSDIGDMAVEVLVDKLNPIEIFKRAFSNWQSWGTELGNFWAESIFGSDDTAGHSAGRSHSSHRNGISYVPYDGYMAELHRGEAVISANDASENKQSADNTFIYNYNISVPESNNALETAKYLRDMNRRERYELA